MAQRKILVPFNFTALEKKSLQFIVDTYKELGGAHITLFHAYAPLPDIDSSGNPEMRKMTQGMAFLSGEKKRKEEGLNNAKDFLVKNGFQLEQIDFIFREKKRFVADEILDAVKEGNYDILVLSRQPGKVKRLFARSVHAKLLTSLKNVTICIPA